MTGKEICPKRRSRKDSLKPCAPLKHEYDDDDDDNGNDDDKLSVKSPSALQAHQNALIYQRYANYS